ncbi:Tn3 family transposase [Francisella noatunensis]|uniref:Tn3 family transposase n=2 Tax=Francisella noatunensis TaxID=657445 RepID=A0A9Q2KZZ2_9GAMM|nr:Tn3 family transposase [Francisella noatunensis]MBK2029396.1 Tn3 family transposase [Francisella noatunensis]MBK2034012.1 Tn3 family transposase [Francisella noatunensis]MBK2049425.1 Tn3 family transposase [Francisella noatunensis]MBK2052299.1 Tn3 family transposase [Francisella noatunensis]MBK2053738.1 Tn3 family transposase [Francisella noatunensis]
MKSAIKIAYRSSEYMNNIADIINATIEGLIQENFELPTFHLLNRLVRHTRHTVNNRIFQQTHSLLSLDNKTHDLERLLKIGSSGKSFFNELKVTPKQPTYKRFKEYMKHFNWLKSLGEFDKYLKDIAKVKIDQFAQEALDSTVSEIKELLPFKKYTLLVCLIYKQQRIAIDILATMFCKLLLSANKQARSTLKSQFDNSKEETSRVLNILRTLVEDGLNIKNYCTLAKTFYSRMRQAGGLEKLHDDCSNLIAINGSDYRGFLSKKVSDKRAMLFEIINALSMKSASQDQSLIKALEYLRKNNNKQSKYLTEPIDLSFATDYWRKRITKTGLFTGTKYNRKEIEACVFNYTQKALNAGDIFIDQGDIFSDYRSEFVHWDECLKYLDSLCEGSEIPNNADDLFSSLKQEMIDKAKSLDNKYLKQNNFVINPDDGRPILKKYEAKQKSEKVLEIEQLIRERMPERTIFDIFINAQKYVGWADEYGPKSGVRDKLKNPIPKYIISSFSYATGLGPTQTVKHVRYDISAQTISRINKKHVSVQILQRAITRIINCLNQFPILKAWGSGKRCAVDGTMEEIRDNNLIAQQHIRYGKKGGVAYRHIADNYIALFSRFIQSGTCEAIHIIDGLLKNASEVNPNIVHGDTQGQSLPVYAFAYLLGIKLMPRIRNWKELNLYKADKAYNYKHIDDIFCEGSIDWDLLKKHWKDLMQVIISIKLGKVSSSFILSKLNSYNSQNKLYKVFSEFGKVIRTNFLLDYIADKDLRQTITENTNKVESYHSLEDWIRFGSSMLTPSNKPDEMEKAIKYTDLLANCIMLQNVIDITEICHQLNKEGYKINLEDLSFMSPYMVEHIKRFGEYVIVMNKRPIKIENVRSRDIFNDK